MRTRSPSSPRRVAAAGQDVCPEAPELYAMVGVTGKRIGPITGAAEYLVDWANCDERTWVPVAFTNGLAEGMLGARDIVANADLADRHADEIVPLTSLNARRLLPPPPAVPTSTSAERVASGSSPITPNAIFYQLLATCAELARSADGHAVPSSRATTTTTAKTTTSESLSFLLPSQLLAAARGPSVTASGAPGTVCPLLPARQPRRTGREAAKQIAKARARTSALARLPKHTAALFGQAASHASVRVASAFTTPDALALDDDCVVVTGLRRVITEPPSKAHRAEGPGSPVQANLHSHGMDEGAERGRSSRDVVNESDNDGDDDDGAASMCRQPYLVDFAVLLDAAEEDGDGDEPILPDPSGVQLTMPLAQFRHQYPQPLIRFLLSNAHVLPLPAAVERTLDGNRA